MFRYIMDHSVAHDDRCLQSPTGQSVQIDWRDGNVPVSRHFGDSYFSAVDGLAETEHVFLRGNRLPERFRSGFRIAELGFGSGLNLLAAWNAWLTSGQSGQLSYVGFEAFPMSPSAMERVHGQWPELASLSRQLMGFWSAGQTRFKTPTLDAEIIIGDARNTVAAWTNTADAWFLDGFSPACNPELWEAELLRSVARRTAPNGTFATYTAAGHVRRNLAEAGFTVCRIPGFGRKRHMTHGRKAVHDPQSLGQ